ncbi:nuclear transport factor 2 family protein [Streptomyces sp. NBC_01257]|uniref:nuclear transport factor 2 family protein n=1 Tax=Streptomyces sp. NBC_01257 TaxID=2903799 RepID=UPI002DD91911|nr:nuclear transport factor 2 family protein [Streptomyces sp. NBC_01257]WRZ69577.1 nuclear transport factor 2 family protein [Streptomyces sp. NBC_01257]
MTTTVTTYGAVPGSAIAGCWAWVTDQGRWRLGGHPHDAAEERELTAVLDVLRSTADSREPLRILLQSRTLAAGLTPGPADREAAEADGHDRPGASPHDGIRRERAGREVDFAWAGTFPGTASAAHPWAVAPHPDAGPERGGTHAPTELREQIVRLESSLLGAEARSDVERLEQLIHHDFDEIGRTGRYWEREEVIRVLHTLPDQVQAVTFDRVVELAPGVAHIRFRTEDARGVVHRSSVWVREGDNWQQRYHQGTPDTQTD